MIEKWGALKRRNIRKKATKRLSLIFNFFGVGVNSSSRGEGCLYVFILIDLGGFSRHRELEWLVKNM